MSCLKHYVLALLERMSGPVAVSPLGPRLTDLLSSRALCLPSLSDTAATSDTAACGHGPVRDAV